VLVFVLTVWKIPYKRNWKGFSRRMGTTKRFLRWFLRIGKTRTPSTVDKRPTKWRREATIRCRVVLGCPRTGGPEVKTGVG